MANFPSFTFTAAGRAAITRSLSGKDVDRLIITKCVLGDGVYSGSIETLKDVTSPKMTVTVSEYTDNGDGTSVTRFVYDNASLDGGFYHREMGIYAKNGDSGTELLLCYSNAGDQYSYIRAGAVDSVTKQREATIPPQTFKFVLATGGSGSVNAVIDPKGYVDVEMLEEHNTDQKSHPDIRQKLNTNASNITALQTSDNAKFKAVSVSNDTLTFTKGDNTTTAVTVNNVANATNATKATQDGNGANIADTYLKKAGDIATGSIVAPSFQTGAADANYFQCRKFRGEGNAYSYYHAVDFGYADKDKVDFYEYGGTWNFYQNQTGKKEDSTLIGSIKPTGWNGNVVGNVTGNATNATKATQDGNGAIIADTYIKKAGDTVTGTLNVPTQATTDNSTKVANTAFVQSAISQLVNSAPSTLDTLNELANALGNDPNFATTVATQIGQKADKTELNNHNTDPTAHENRFSLFQKIATLGEDVIKKLALTTAITAITALETNSWFGQLLKMVLNASGVKYSMAQNGYICLGSFFGGLIIQWFRNNGSSGWNVVNYPIAMTATYAVIPVTISNGRADRSNLYKYYPLVSTYNTASSECWLEGDSLIIVIGR